QTGTMRLTQQNAGTYTYDPNGNLKTAPNATFTYTLDNMLESATVAGSPTALYFYDADQWRSKKTSGSNTSYFFRGARGELLTEWAKPGGAWESIRDYICGGARLLAEVERTAPIGTPPALPPLPGPVSTPPVPGFIGSPGTTIPDEGGEPPPPPPNCSDPA